jgi:DNA modification methylase
LKIFLEKTKNIIFKENLPRLREDLGDLQSLADSFQRFGQITPIIVSACPTREAGEDLKYYLIAGERRLRACRILKIDVHCVSRNDVDDTEMRELEIEENIKRKQFTPAEELKAIEELHNLKIAKHGKVSRGDVEGGWGTKETGKILGFSAGAVSDKLKMAKVIRAYPAIGKLKKESDIRKAIKQIEKVAKRASAIKRLKEMPRAKNKIFGTLELTTGSASEFMMEQKSASFDLVLTDPPYGINIDKTQSIGSVKFGNFTFEDKFASSIEMYYNLATESFRITKVNGHAVIFFAPEFYEIVKRSFMQAGWLTNHRPLIWIKQASGQCINPSMWPVNAYEFFFLFRKKDSRLVQSSMLDWMQCNTLSSEKRVHPTEKPVSLLREIIKNLTLPGHTLIDPFMGSGSSLEAGILEQLEVSGNDIAQECYDMAFYRLSNLRNLSEKV